MYIEHFTWPERRGGSVAEWSKTQVLGTSLFGGVGSNPTAAIFLIISTFSLRLSYAATSGVRRNGKELVINILEKQALITPPLVVLTRDKGFMITKVSQ